MKEVLVRLDRCVGCHSCEIACAVEHSESKNLFGAVAEKPVPRKRIYVEYSPEQMIPVTMICHHCEDAPCVSVCPTGALTQDEISRVVTHNPDICVGCWTCAMVCNYGMIGKHKEKRVAIKCDRCPDRDVPACVVACPTRALTFTEVEDFSGSIRADAALTLARGIVGGGTP
ncbi:MAG: 4Fe-4S dicluster domain-containing protein [Euryarchaeota archaeon]|nr:4Fe-4S dicluster domain-containing protein [Euryarchaeota archaeon]